MPHLDRDGVRVFYEAHGDGASSSPARGLRWAGPPILLGHGYSSTSRMWAGQVEPLSKEHRLVVWDMRGHGRSDSPDDDSLYSQDATVEDMSALLDAAGAERAVLGGHSLGGYMSLDFTLVHPERVAALMLLNTGPGFRSDDARAKWNDRAQRLASILEERGLGSLRGGPEVRAEEHGSAGGLARAARGLLAQRDARVIDALPKIEVPTLVVVGSQDADYHAAADYMARKIPGATKVVIPGAGHAANIEQPDAFNTAVLEFLDGQR